MSDVSDRDPPRRGEACLASTLSGAFSITHPDGRIVHFAEGDFVVIEADTPHRHHETEGAAELVVYEPHVRRRGFSPPENPHEPIFIFLSGKFHGALIP